MGKTRKRADRDGWLTVEAPGQRQRVYLRDGDEVTIDFEPDGEGQP